MFLLDVINPIALVAGAALPIIAVNIIIVIVVLIFKRR